MIVTNNERWVYKVIKRKPNSSYEWDYDNPILFKGRPASQREKKQYRLQQGVNTSTDSVFVYATNLPADLKIGDKIIFQGREGVVNSLGYYYDATRIINPNILNEEYIEKRCPKGVTIG